MIALTGSSCALAAAGGPALRGPRLARGADRATPRSAAKRAILRRHPAAAAAAADGGEAAPPPLPPPPAADSPSADERALLLEALDSGSDEEVAAKLEALQQQWPANPHFVVARARLAAKAGDAATARALFERAAEVAAGAEARDASIALHAWANFEVGQGRRDAAAALAQRAVQADPKHAVPHSLLGKLAEEAGQLAAAEQHYEAALAAEPRHAPSLQATALLAARQGRATAARAAFKRAIEACPENAPLYQVRFCALGSSLFSWGRPEYAPLYQLCFVHARGCRQLVWCEDLRRLGGPRLHGSLLACCPACLWPPAILPAVLLLTKVRSSCPPALLSRLPSCSHPPPLPVLVISGGCRV